MSRGHLAVDGEIFVAYPDYRAQVVYATKLVNGPSTDRSRAFLSDAVRRAAPQVPDDRLSSHPHIAAWRETFSSFGAKPSRYPSSVEALLARSLNGGTAPSINLLVDAYNAVSIAHILPAGGEDWDKLEGVGALR